MGERERGGGERTIEGEKVGREKMGIGKMFGARKRIE